MTLTIAEIRLLALYFNNEQLTMLFDISPRGIETALAGMPIPTPNILALPAALDRLEIMDRLSQSLP